MDTSLVTSFAPASESAPSVVDGGRAERQLVRFCARPALQAREKERLASIDAGRMDWQFLLEHARLHGVLAMVYHHLSRSMAGEVPPGVLQTMERASRRTQMHNLVAMQELARLAATFQMEEIPLLAFKGPLLAQQYYGNIAFRTFGDVDVLVQRTHLNRSRVLLESCGYKTVDPVTEADVKSRREGQIGLEYRHPETSVVIELHSALLNRTLSLGLTAEGVWRRAGRFALGSTSVNVLHPDDLLVYLSAHGTKHYWSRLQCASDIARVIENHPSPDWHALVADARKAGHARTLALGVQLTERWLGTRVPEPLQRLAQSDPMVKRLVVEVEEKWFGTEEGIRPQAGWSTFWFAFRSRERVRDNLSLLRHHFHLLVGPTERDEALLPAWIRSRAPFLSLVVRPVRLLAKGVGALLPASTPSLHEVAIASRSDVTSPSRTANGMVERFLSHSLDDYRTLASAAGTAAVVAVLLHVFSFGRVLHILDRWSRSTSASTRGLSSEDERRILWAVEVASRRIVPRRPCLTQALTARTLLIRQGACQVKLQFGVARTDGGEFEAHAWLERDGDVLIGGGRSHREYTPLRSRTSTRE